MRGGRFLSCRHGAIGVVHLVVVHGPGHGVDFSGIVCSNDMFVERFPSHVMLLPVTCPVIIEEINKLILDTYMNFYCDVILKSKSF